MEHAVTFHAISKYFASTQVQANKDVSFSIRRGEIHAICGENGAGKSTLMNILFGITKPDSGMLEVNGKEQAFASPSDAIAAGIGMVHQHFKVVNSFTVTKNILLGIERGKFGFINSKAEQAFVEQLSAKYSLPIKADQIVGTLQVGQLQRVEILKMLARNVSILILDEPTAVLTPQEVKPFLATLKELAKAGQTILFISHKLQEVLDVADRVTVMKKGEVVGTKETKDTTLAELAMMMVGREVLFTVEKSDPDPKDVVLTVENLSVVNQLGVKVLSDVSFSIRSGEIYGLAGVSGNGQEALVNAICGLEKVAGGSIVLEHKDITQADVIKRKELGMSHVPEDRINVGLNLSTSIKENSILGFQRKKPFRKRFFLDSMVCESHTQQIIEKYQVAGAHANGEVGKLSGGNMQKIVLGRELASKPRLLIVNQPTRGLDVGSIEFVHRMLIKQRDEGVAILLVSVELEEILSMSDRVGVLCAGILQGELLEHEMNERNIGILMVGGSLDETAK
ncbi:ABC transporter ATP-binding protein [Sphaerochaeta globosa]|uniref:Monosaccharide-transporting ATPase n=1 Tax=Sphaerochaeta globosa (strain ATCC BAA-1886 / DSM 22777 / Buddy) TaxID=158189 RepID=F0RRJ2_SPHGB|nr:ABC transporter ATP-binding protein [Sphaerochaeta globosa]ADY14244.1 Monosaccharide-transporting ATPase [Sphaerochaeta globosa str. Buddy]